MLLPSSWRTATAVMNVPPGTAGLTVWLKLTGTFWVVGVKVV